jgi:hypothetical protein
MSHWFSGVQASKQANMSFTNNLRYILRHLPQSAEAEEIEEEAPTHILLCTCSRINVQHELLK